MSFQKVMVGLAVILLASAGVASATTVVTHTLVVSGEFNASTGATISTNAATIAANIAAGAADIYRIDINTQVSNLPAGNSYGDEQFDLLLSDAHLTRVPANLGATVKANWAASRPAMPAGTQDQNGNPVSDYYSGGQNKDAGASSTDLLAILVAIDPSNVGQLSDADTNPISDPRQTMAQGSPLKLGSIFVKWDGSTTPSTINLANGQYSDYQSSNGQFGTVQNVAGVSSAPVFQAVPEPASIALMGMASLGMFIARRRRS